MLDKKYSQPLDIDEYGNVHHNKAPENVFECVDEELSDNQPKEYIAYVCGQSLVKEGASAWAALVQKDGQNIHSLRDALMAPSTSGLAMLDGVLNVLKKIPPTAQVDLYVNEVQVMNFLTFKKYTYNVDLKKLVKKFAKIANKHGKIVFHQLSKCKRKDRWYNHYCTNLVKANAKAEYLWYISGGNIKKYRMTKRSSLKGGSIIAGTTVMVINAKCNKKKKDDVLSFFE